MKGQFTAWLTLLIMLIGCSITCAETLDPISYKLLAAVPIMQRGMTQITLLPASTGFHVSVSRAIASHIVVRGVVGTRGSFDLRLRLLAPLELAPAFLAVELSPRNVTGLMTLFFGPVAVDLGRMWFEPARWALIQWVVNPQLTMVLGGVQQSEKIIPQVGWRLFPTSSGRWEVGMMFGRDEIKLTFGGILCCAVF